MSSNASNTSSNNDSSLRHVYFFIDQASDHKTMEENTAPSVSSTSLLTRSRTSSPNSKDTDSASFTTTASSTSHSQSDMNPLAKEFTPSPKKSIAPAPAPSTPPPPSGSTLLYELRLTPDKGLGLFSTTSIPRGTLILCEKPLLKVDSDEIHHVWGPYCRLSNAQKKIYDSLHCFQPPHLNLAGGARAHLIDPYDNSMDKDDIEGLVVEQVHVMSRFVVNALAFPEGNPGAAVYATACRLNHSCVPNVHHSFNPTLKKLTVYAARDILAGEELFTTYLGGPAVYETHIARQTALSNGYGFTCRCIACADTTNASDARRDLMAAISWGLNEYNAGQLPSQFGEPMCRFIPSEKKLALKQAEDLIALLLAEGSVTVELMKAYRQASSVALWLGDIEKALEYADNEATVEKNCLGEVVDDMVKAGVASQCWRKEIERAISNGGGGEGGAGKNSFHKKVKIRKAKKVKRADEAKVRDEVKDADEKKVDEMAGSKEGEGVSKTE